MLDMGMSAKSSSQKFVKDTIEIRQTSKPKLQYNGPQYLLA